MKRIAFLGSGSLAIDLCERVQLWNQYEVAGFIDGNCEKGSMINGLPVLGNDDDVIDLYKSGVFDCIYIAIGYLKYEIRENKDYFNWNIYSALVKVNKAFYIIYNIVEIFLKMKLQKYLQKLKILKILNICKFIL